MRKLGAGALVIVGLLVLGQSFGLLALPLTVLINARAMGALGRGLFALTLAPALAAAAFGAFLVGMRRSLSRRWFDDATVDLPLDPVQLLRLGVIITGIALLSQGLLGALQSLSSLAQMISFGGDQPSQVLWSNLYTAVPRILILVVGAVLIWWSAPLASRLWSGSATPAASTQVEGTRCPSCGALYDSADYRPGVPRKCDTCGEPLGGGV